MKNPLDNAGVALGVVLTMLTIWSFVDMGKNKIKPNNEHVSMNKKLDLILARLNKQ